MPSEEDGSLAAQLADLYAERETLMNELGVSSTTDIVSMVRSLEAQLHDLYADREEK